MSASPAPSFQSAIDQAHRGEDLAVDQTSDLIDSMLRGDASEDAVGELLLALRAKGESVAELVGAATAMRRHMTRISHHHDVLLDTCGTGGSGSGTFNISTAVAIVAAACGVAVAKHGNRKATSLSGSADVLEELGVRIESEADAVAQRLDSIGICFCFAAKLHPAMRHVVGVRRKLGVKTLFNLLGPLCNPAGATHQLLGTSTPDAQTKVAAAIHQLGTTRSFVIHADDGQDEVSLDGTTTAVEVTSGGQQTLTWSASDFGLLPVGADALAAANPSESAAIIRRIFAAEPGPCRDTVIAGTSAALLLVGKVPTVADGAKMAAAAIDEGRASEKLAQLGS
ncbi:Anthranilate phosphoribosyltransferase [Rubripirellula lacrimiformis]|uniref:Anthranilate phosphoribosyltransferase n=1 Tax=Rubripirellula lacrimiformis TaxID=1930273 RepID=A0A517NKF9_9BACT|nr:anthranilate phosphoribosyltransferase [Rubripirellula lacrimiformis]QDT07523.1 Anthranilate phosphoribosyltransferase [Rubripirellula lacrimiformis]